MEKDADGFYNPSAADVPPAPDAAKPAPPEDDGMARIATPLSFPANKPPGATSDLIKSTFEVTVSVPCGISTTLSQPSTSKGYASRSTARPGLAFIQCKDV